MDRTDICIRRAGFADLEQLVPLFEAYRAFYGQSPAGDAARAFLQTRLEQGDALLLVAESNAALVGFTQLYPSFSSVGLARTFILNDLFVAPAARRDGIARRLLDAAAEHARAANAVRLTLSTAHTNLVAQALYRACDWLRDDQFQVFHKHL